MNPTENPVSSFSSLTIHHMHSPKPSHDLSTASLSTMFLHVTQGPGNLDTQFPDIHLISNTTPESLLKLPFPPECPLLAIAPQFHSGAI